MAMDPMYTTFPQPERSPFATPPATPPAPAGTFSDEAVDELFGRLQEVRQRRGAAAARQPAKSPSLFSRVDWTDIRKKVWHAGLIVASAYVSAKPEKYAWLMPVLTAIAGSSAPPTASPKAAMAMVLVIMFAVTAARAAVWAF